MNTDSNHASKILLQGVSKSYPTPAGAVRALTDVELEVAPGEFLLVRGRSGSGKTTLIHLLTGVDTPSQGRVLHGGTAIEGLSEAQRASWRGREVGVVFQFFQLLPTLTVRENVELPMELLGEIELPDRIERARTLLDQVGVLDQQDKFPGQLSGGQQQRVAIARALANHPTLIVADEPTGNLDSTTAEQVMHLLRSLVDEGRTLVLVSHDPEARRWADREVLLDDGFLTNGLLEKSAGEKALPAGVSA